MVKNKKKTGFIILTMIMIMLSGCGQSQTSDNIMREIVDMAGRTIEIPTEINKVYSTGPIGTVFLYTLSPEKIAGWNHDLREVERTYINEDYHDLPALGTWRGLKYSGNIEELLKVKPDLIINMGDVDEKYIADTDAIQKQLGIPVLMVDGGINSSSDSYKFLGEILGVEDRSELLAQYCEDTIIEVVKKLSLIPENKKKRLYYAEGIKGLETQAKGSMNSEILDLAGVINVAEPGIDGNVNRIEISLEQLLNWDPEVIILSTDGDLDGELYKTITEDAIWSELNAVKNQEVYEIPSAPYDWINRPPSVNRIIGIKWLSNLLYPEVYKLDIKDEISEFFSLFYQHNLSPEDLDKILLRSSIK